MHEEAKTYLGVATVSLLIFKRQINVVSIIASIIMHKIVLLARQTAFLVGMRFVANPSRGILFQQIS